MVVEESTSTGRADQSSGQEAGLDQERYARALNDARWILGCTHSAAWVRPDCALDTVLWSDEMALLLGYEAGTLSPSLSDFLARVVPAEGSLEAVKRAFERPVTEGEDRALEFRVFDAKGEQRWLRLVGVGPLCNGPQSPPRAVALRGVFMDITASKLVALRAVEDAKHKTEFLGRMSHDMRTPLHAIIGLGEVVRSALPGAPALAQVDGIIEAAEGLLGLVNDLLDIEHIRGGRSLHDARPVELRRVIWDCVSLHRQALRQAAVEVHCHIDPQVPRFVVSDAKLLSRILGNLLENALKFTSKGVVTVSCSVRAKREQMSEVSLRVADTGMGIDSEDLKQIFTPFFRGKLEADKPRGQGLGLSIVRDLVTQLGGQVAVSSTRGKGSVFEVLLPLHEALTSPSPTSLSSASSLSVDAGLARTASLEAHAQTGGDKAVDACVHAQPVLDVLFEPETKRQGPSHGDHIEVLAPTSAKLAPSLSCQRILIVDDSPVNRQIFAAFLQGTGAQVVFAQDGREALGLFPNMHPDLVIMDLCMPIMSGAEATEAIRDLEASLGWERCPILAVSASALREDVAAAEAAGCDEHFAKPIRRGALVGAIEKHLHRAATRPVSAGGMCLSPLSRQATLGPAAGDGRMGS